MAERNSGPWGGGGKKKNGQDSGENKEQDAPKRPKPPVNNEIDDLVRKGQESLRVLMGGKGGDNSGGGFGQDGIPRAFWGVGFLVLVILWAVLSFYTVKPEERSVELFLGEYYATGDSGLNFAPWPLVTAEVVSVTSERIVEIGTGRNSSNAGLMLTGDENVVDIDFQVVWNITDPAKLLFNLAQPELTIAAVSESAIREIVAQTTLAPILNRDRGVIADRLQELIQQTLDSYDSGVNIVRVNFDKADPPAQVIDAFRDVQAAEQERDRLQNEADAYANRTLAEARGEAAQILEQAEAYRAQVINGAEGEASRFSAVLNEYLKAPEVTRKRLYLETMEQVLGRVDKIILDEQGQGNGQGIVPYLPLNELRKPTANRGN